MDESRYEVLFKTRHGSFLYGLNHAGSDEDFFTVVSKVKSRKAKFSRQSIVGGIDTTMIDLGTWLHYCEAGVPQSLEAMFASGDNVLVDNIAPLRLGYRAGTQTWDRYLRTIKSFAMEDTYKTKRHALRLALNLAELRGSGRFNPTLTQEQKSWVGLFANMPGTHVYRLATEAVWK
jgi:predicted nucleotidyltransferase